MLNKKNSENLKVNAFKFFFKQNYTQKLEKIKYKFEQEEYNKLTDMMESDDYETLLLLKEIINERARN